MSKKQYQIKNKLGRNFPCFCGSGKKYKHCCLNSVATSNESKLLIEASKNKLATKHSDDQCICIDGDSIGATKMSEVILEYAEELLDIASTDENMETAIKLAIVVWNISILAKEEHSRMIDDFLKKVMSIKKNSAHWEQACAIFQALINKKLAKYPSVNRMIIGYDFVKLSKNDFHLNVISTLY